MNRIAAALLALTVMFVVVSTPSIAQLRPDEEKVFELAPGASSESYRRPEGADYFWWDADPKIEVELTFEDGAKKRTSSEESFSKKIVAVTFINPTKIRQKVILRTGP